MDAIEGLLMAGLGLGGAYVISGGFSGKDKETGGGGSLGLPPGLAKLMQGGNMPNIEMPNINIDQASPTGQEDIFNKLRDLGPNELLPKDIGPTDPNKEKDKPGQDQGQDFGLIGNPIKSFLSGPRRAVSSEFKEYGKDAGTLRDKITNIAVNPGLPAAAGLATGGPIGAAVVGGSGIVGEEIGHRASDAAPGLRDSIIRNTGGKNSPFAKIGKLGHTLLKGRDPKELELKESAKVDYTGDGSSGSKTQDKDKEKTTQETTTDITTGGGSTTASADLDLDPGKTAKRSKDKTKDKDKDKDKKTQRTQKDIAQDFRDPSRNPITGERYFQ